MYQERWTVEKRPDGTYHFTVKKAAPPVVAVIVGVLMIPFFGVGFIILAANVLPRLSPSRFSVGPAGFEVRGQKIPMARVNSWGVMGRDGIASRSVTSKAFRLVIQVGGSRVELATALTEDQAAGLMADVERAAKGDL